MQGRAGIVAPMPVDLSRWRPADMTGGTGPAEPVIAMVGRLDRLKAPEILLEAVGRMHLASPPRIVFAGRSHSSEAPDGSDMGAWLQRRASDLQIEIDLVGHLPGEAVADLYRASRVVAVPSRYETFSLAALEAMACGRPVVVTDATGIAEWLAGEWPALVVPHDDPDRLAAALMPFVLDEAHANTVGTALRRQVEEQFDPQIVARQRIRLYEQLLGGGYSPT